MYRIVAGQAPTTKKGAGAREKIRRLMHGAAVAIDVAKAPERADWLYDLRRGRLQIYGGLLRYIDTAIRQGKSREELQKIPQWIACYIDEQYEPTNTGEIRLIA